MPIGPDLVPTVLLLHQGGWDEVLMVAVGLVVAYLVIVWTGRRSGDGDEEGDLADDEQADPAPNETRSRPS